MLQVTHVSKSYGIATVLEDISFIVNPGDRVGLIGPNGCGKTTLLRILVGLETPDTGHVRLDPSASLGYLAQGLPIDEASVLGAHVRSGLAGYELARHSIEQLAGQMASDNSAELLNAYAQAVEHFESLGGYGVENRVSAILQGLDLASLDPDTPLARLSGGQRTRAGLARLLLSEPSLLILDEPTNHLDIAALEWLEEFLTTYSGAALVVSHDRTFLDATVSRILELDDRTHRLAEYTGNYSAYAQAKSSELDRQWSDWQDQQEEIARLTTAAAHLRGLAKFRKGGKADTGDKFAKGFFANRGLGTMKRAKRIEARLDKLKTEDRIDKPLSSWQMKLEFGSMPRGGQMVLTLDHLGHRFDERWLFRHADLVLRHGERVALVGSNGSGKTTLLRILAGELTPSEGTARIGSNVQIGYMPQEQENLDPEETPLALIRRLAPLDETAARHLLHFFLFQGEEVFTPIGRLSYGERARLVLAELVVGGANCLLLDEPINHLDMPSRERFQVALDAFPGTVLVATHDRAFIDHIATGIWTPEDGTLRSHDY